MQCKKVVTLEVSCESDEVWQETLEEVKEILNMMNNLKRHAKVISIKEE